jgi:hypothetical protein
MTAAGSMIAVLADSPTLSSIIEPSIVNEHSTAGKSAKLGWNSRCFAVKPETSATSTSITRRNHCESASDSKTASFAKHPALIPLFALLLHS